MTKDQPGVETYTVKLTLRLLDASEEASALEVVDLEELIEAAIESALFVTAKATAERTDR